MKEMDFAALWREALEAEADAHGAVLLLCDAIAYGCAEMDLHPPSAFPRIEETFERLHVAKYLGVKQ